MSYETIRYEVDGGIATVTLDEPETRNALSAEMIAELRQALESAHNDEEGGRGVRLLLLFLLDCHGGCSMAALLTLTLTLTLTRSV